MENFHKIKENLREILGVEAAQRCSDSQIQALLDSFESRPDCVECVLQSLCEQSFEGAFGEEIVTDEGFVFLGDQDIEVCHTYQQLQQHRERQPRGVWWLRTTQLRRRV